ncbi:MAG: LPS export ABC transporter periplasmic protein LptC, partial [Gammaproteobacteria bacterium]
GDEARVVQPRLELLRPQGPPWVLEAPRGRVLEEGRLVWLEGGVRLSRRRPGRGPLVLSTVRLRVRPYQGLAETEEPVRIRDPWGELRAVGLRAELNRDRLELLREVRGVYRMP